MTHTEDHQRLHETILAHASEIEALTDDTASDWLDAVLDVEMYLQQRDYETRFSHMEILLAYGGPTVRLRWDGRTSLILEATSMSSRTTTSVDSSVLVEVLEQYTDLHF